jgi:hypothetical protein
VPDADGWYPVLPEGDLVFPHWLLNWPTVYYPNGQYVVRLQLADGTKTPIPALVSDPVAFMVDNRACNAGFSQLRWREVGGSWTTLPLVCPVIERDLGDIVEVEVSWFANAVHFRNAAISAGGCGGGNPTRPPGSNDHDYDHWHINPGDNAITRASVFRLEASGQPLQAGCYTFTITAYTRAFNPAGDGGGPGVDWCADYGYIYVTPSVAVSVVDV